MDISRITKNSKIKLKHIKKFNHVSLMVPTATMEKFKIYCAKHETNVNRVVNEFIKECVLKGHKDGLW